MIALQAAPPLIPDAGTLDRLAGPHGGLVAVAIVAALAISALVWMVRRAFTREEAFATAKDKQAEQLLKQHEDYTEKLLAQKNEYIGKLEGYLERLIKGNQDDIALQRELGNQMRDLTTSVRSVVKLP